MTEQSVTPEQTARQQTGPASPLVPLVTMPDLGALTGMVCDIDDPDCVAPAVPLVTTTDEDEA